MFGAIVELANFIFGMEEAIRETGCEELNEQVLECYYEWKDWRRCSKEVKEFKECMERYQKEKSQIKK